LNVISADASGRGYSGISHDKNIISLSSYHSSLSSRFSVVGESPFLGRIADVLLVALVFWFQTFEIFGANFFSIHSDRISREGFSSAGQQNRFSGSDVTKILVVKRNYSGNIFDYRIID
jgi:hypothetical protein